MKRPSLIIARQGGALKKSEFTINGNRTGRIDGSAAVSGGKGGGGRAGRCRVTVTSRSQAAWGLLRGTAPNTGPPPPFPRPPVQFKNFKKAPAHTVMFVIQDPLDRLDLPSRSRQDLMIARGTRHGKEAMRWSIGAISALPSLRPVSAHRSPARCTS